MILRPRKYKELEKALGHRFKNQKLIEMALTHASMRGGKVQHSDNERLEFIGDRVLGLVIAEALSERFPRPARASWRAATIGWCAAKPAPASPASWVWAQHLILSESEAGSGGRAKGTILADAMEAILGAIFLDAGFEPARVRRCAACGPARTTSTRPAPAPDAKSALQEWAQGKGLALPEYVEVGRKGPDHAPRFTSEVRIDGCAPARGEGASKRAAEQAAARALLEREGVAGAELHE